MNNGTNNNNAHNNDAPRLPASSARQPLLHAFKPMAGPRPENNVFNDACPSAAGSTPTRATPAWIVVLVLLASAALIAGTVLSSGKGLVLYFPAKKGTALVAERRMPPLFGSVEDKAVQIVAALLIGPANRAAKPFFVADVRLRSVLLRNNRLYVDLSEEAGKSATVTPPVLLRALEQSLRENIPGSGTLFLSIQGKELRLR